MWESPLKAPPHLGTKNAFKIYSSIKEKVKYGKLKI